ncbi:MAG: 23S rRNA (pseudouridine(1915)-N(3))-methyltransferase RlmH [Bdellovibrionales bacterium]
MNIEILCPELKKLKMASEAVGRYIPRTNRFTPCVLKEFKTEKNGSPEYKIEKEESEILKKISDKDFLVVLDEKGKSFRTIDLSQKIADLQNNQGVQKMIFLIGGPYGLSSKIKERANLKVRLSDLTYNSEVAVVVLAEQVYRTFSLIAGHPYHNE